MNEEIREFHAATVEAAVQKAASELGVSSEALDYEILDTGSSGFMGIGGRDARISTRTATTSNDGQTSPSYSRDVDFPTEETETAEPEEAREHEYSSDTDSQEAAPQELLDDTRGYMDQIVELMGLDARVDVYDAGEFVAVDVSTEQAGLFIGQKGETIDAVQHLLGLAVYKDRKFGKRLVIDSEGYRQRRVEAIQGIAHRMARRAVRERRGVELPPMNASERRVVHVYLQENEKVFTRSEGNDDNRRVKVFPA